MRIIVRHLIGVISILNIASCTWKEQVEIQEDSTTALEYEIISQTIKQLTLPPPPPPPPPLKGYENLSIEEKQKLIEGHQADYAEYISTETLSCYLKPILYSPNNGREHYLQDSAYLSLALKWKNENLSDKALDISQIFSEKFSVRTNTDQNDEFLNYTCSAQYSRIVFSDDLSIALFHFDYSCGGLCGGGHFILVQKLKGKWKIIRKDPTWVS